MNGTYWWMEDWRRNPLIQRSRNPLLKQLAMERLQRAIEHGKTPDTIGMICTMSHRIADQETGYRWEVVSGMYLIPGDNGVRCSSRQIGAMVEYDDGRVIWDVFSLPELYAGCRDGAKPVQMVMF